MLAPPRTPPVASWKAGTPLTKATVDGAMTRKTTARTSAMIAVPMATDLRLSAASRTVKARISRCGRPMVPRAKPATSETVENRSIFSPPSEKRLAPISCAAAARS